MRGAVLSLATAVLLCAATVLAFFSGGYFEAARLPAAIVAWVLVLVAALATPHPLPRSRAGWATVGGLALLLAWSALSLAWAPLSTPAVESLQRLVLYLGTLLAAVALLRPRRAARAVEPVLALGALVVIAYGLAERLLPGLLTYDHAFFFGGRLDQPLTYSNAEGLLAALGIVLAARVAGDGTRPVLVRAGAAAAWVPLGAGVYLSYSRGALAAGTVGLALLVLFAPSWAQLRAAGAAALVGAVAAGVCAVFPQVAYLDPSAPPHQRDGLMALALLLGLAGAVAWGTRRAVGLEATAGLREGRLRLPRRAWVPATLLAALVAAGLVAGGLGERADASPGAQVERGADRLTSLSSNRYEYWRVAAEEWAAHPIRGIGTGGFQVAWTRERRIDEGSRNAHSLQLEIATELGLVGLLALGVMLAGVGLAGRAALRRRRVLAAGPCAALAVWLLHATIDWDWSMPAVTIPALVLAGALVAASEAAADDEPGAGARLTAARLLDARPARAAAAEGASVGSR